MTKDTETHNVCNNRLNEKGGLAVCCDCFPHDNCNLGHSKTESMEESVGVLIGKLMAYQGVTQPLPNLIAFVEDLKPIYDLITSEIKAAEVRGMEKAEKEFSKIRGFTENQHDWVDTCDVYKMFQQLRQKLIGE